MDSGEDVYMDSPNDVTSGPSCTTAVSTSSPKNGAVPTLELPPPFNNFRRLQIEKQCSINM